MVTRRLVVSSDVAIVLEFAAAAPVGADDSDSHATLAPGVLSEVADNPTLQPRSSNPRV